MKTIVIVFSFEAYEAILMFIEFAGCDDADGFE